MKKRLGVSAKIIAVFTVCSLLTQAIFIPLAQGQQMIGSNTVYSQSSVPILKGLKILPSQGLKMAFYFDQVHEPAIRSMLERVVRIFLSGLTFDSKDIWVNLSPYEQSSIMTDSLSVTELGLMMAQQDYLLKQRASALTNPDTPTGQLFWREARAIGMSNKAVNSFSKVWIVPDKADVLVGKDSAYLGQVHLKVMAQEDYLALKKHQKVNVVKGDHLSNLMREVVCKALEKEVNESEDFAPLRLVFNTLILAYWFKTFHGKPLSSFNYINSNKTKGINLVKQVQINDVFDQYRKYYKKGAYNFVKEDVENGQIIPRKYFSGGLRFDPAAISFSPLKKLKHLALIAVTVSFMALLSPSAFAGQAGIVPPAAVHSVEMIQQTASPSAAKIMGYMVKSHAPDQIEFSLTSSDQGKIGQMLVQKIVDKTNGWARPDLGGGIYQAILNGGAVWVQQADGTQIMLNQQTIDSYKVHQGDVLVMQNRVPANQTLAQPKARLDKPVVSLPEVKPSTTSTVAGSPPPPDELGDLDKYFQPGAIPKVQLPNTDPNAVRISLTQENGGLSLAGSSGVAGYNFTNIQLEKPVGPVSLHGGLRVNLAPTAFGMSGMSINTNQYMGAVIPYLGLLVPIPNTVFQTYAEVSGMNKESFGVHAGVQREPRYFQGLSYTYGLGAYYMESMFSGNFWGYFSYKLKNGENPKFITFSPQISLSPKTKGAVGFGGKVQYINGPWSLTGEFNPLKPAEMSIHHDLLYMGQLNFRDSLKLERTLDNQGDYRLFAQAGHLWRPEQNRQKTSAAAILGIRIILGNPVNHGTSIGNNSSDFSNPKPPLYLNHLWQKKNPSTTGSGAPPDGDNSMLSTRRLVLLAGPSLLISKAAQAGNDEILKVYALPEPKFPLCGLPNDVILSLGDNVIINHLLYFAFLYSYLTDKSFQIDGDELSPEVKLFSNMPAWQWYKIIFSQNLSRIHLSFAEAVQHKMKAAMRLSGREGEIKPEDRLNGPVRIFDTRFRVWIDKWISFRKLNQEDILNTLAKRAMISYLQMLYPNEQVGSIISKARRYLITRGYLINPFGDSIDQPMANAIISEILKESLAFPDKAQLADLKGGIDFGGLAQITSWKGSFEKLTLFNYNPKNDIVGMTFEILEIRISNMFDIQ